jgi:uncharacterized protein
MTAGQIAMMMGAAAGGGLMNAMAGGGTIVTFPILVFLGEPSIIANATSTVALLPGAAASLVGYRDEVLTHKEWLKTLLLPSLLGGGLGSLLLLRTPESTFAALAPLLVLFATLLFMLQGFLARRRTQRAAPQGIAAGPAGQSAAAPDGKQQPASMASGKQQAGAGVAVTRQLAGRSGDQQAAKTPGGAPQAGDEAAGTRPIGLAGGDGQAARAPVARRQAGAGTSVQLSSRRWAVAIFFQFLISVYGGYFGAAIGILMLAVLGFLGLSNIFAMNGLKNFFGFCINGVAAAYFILRGAVVWPVALLMMAGSIAGGYGGARLARRIGQEKARAAVVVIGLVVTAILFWQHTQAAK